MVGGDPYESNELAGRKQGRANSGHAQKDAEIIARAQHVDRDVEDRDRLEEVGAVDAERAHVVGGDDDAHHAGEKQQSDGDVVGRARPGQSLLGPENGHVGRDREQDQILQERGRKRPDAPPHYVQRQARGRERQHPERRSPGSRGGHELRGRGVRAREL